MCKALMAKRVEGVDLDGSYGSMLTLFMDMSLSRWIQKHRCQRPSANHGPPRHWIKYHDGSPFDNVSNQTHNIKYEVPPSQSRPVRALF
jgi:hypothetical protein